jgi:hypothetical protein
VRISTIAKYLNNRFLIIRILSVRIGSLLHASKGKTLFDKIWESHLVDDNGDNSLIYIDRHLVHEVTSPQAFEVASFLSSILLSKASSLLAGLARCTSLGQKT